jgi:hypothetical protein
MPTIGLCAAEVGVWGLVSYFTQASRKLGG